MDILRLRIVALTLSVIMAVCSGISFAAPVESSQADATVTAGFAKATLTLADGGRMNYYQRPGTGPTLVLVPGTWGGIWRFEKLIAALPPSMPIAVVELCWQDGHSPPTLDLSIEQLSDDVLRAIETMELEHYVVSGHSIGGMIAVEIAGRELPGLVGAIPMEGWTHHTVVKTAFQGDVVINLTPEEKAARTADRARGRGHLSDEELRAIGTIWRHWNGYEGLRRSTIPILEIWGDRGRPRPDHKALQIPERKNITVAWIADASHLVLVEDPSAVARLVIGFMARVT